MDGEENNKNGEEYVEVIGVEYLKTILSDLSPKDIVSPAYNHWVACQQSGYTILNLETGKVLGLSLEPNQLPLKDDIFIVLYTILSSEDPVSAKDLLSEEEYEEYEDFNDDPSGYTPDILSEFCKEHGIDEDARKITILADRFEENEYWNYNKWEAGVLNEYYDAIQEEHYTFKTVDQYV